MVYHSVLAMGMTVLFLLMLCRKSKATRRLSALPLGIASMEMLLAGSVSPLAYPLLTVAMLVLYVGIFIGCVRMLRRRKRRAVANAVHVVEPVLKMVS